MRTTATNVGAEACPFGSGQHPYLTLGTSVVDSLVLRRAGMHGSDRGRARPPASGESLSTGPSSTSAARGEIGETTLDDAFTDLERGEDGCARVELRDPTSRAGVTLWLDETYRYLQLFTGDPLPDVRRRSLAVEPMTCPANAFRTGEDLVRLEPGESCASAWGIVPG